MPQIYLIGTAHICLHGSDRLKSALEEIMPDVVLCEGDINKRIARLNYLKFLKEFLNKLNIEKQLTEAVIEKQLRAGYESRVSEQFAHNNRKEFSYLKDKIPTPDIQKLRAEAKEEVRDIIRNNVTLELFNERINARQKRTDSDWGYLKKVIGTEQEMVDTLANVQKERRVMGKRDLTMENTLRSYVADTNYSKIATVTGFSHILDDPEKRTFYTLIKDLNPLRRFLFE